MREAAAERAKSKGSSDASLRAGVTSGKHLDPVAQLVVDEFVAAGLSESELFHGKKVELPGAYRAEKQWDVVAIHNGELVAAVEFKSILGSYGNNMNNRTEEALGNACDLIEAGESGLLGKTPPWLGYVFLMQDDDGSRRPVTVRETHFEVDLIFKHASYQDRAIILLRRLLQKRLYNAAWFVTGTGDGTRDGIREPAPELSWSKFRAAIRGRVGEVLA